MYMNVMWVYVYRCVYACVLYLCLLCVHILCVCIYVWHACMCVHVFMRMFNVGIHMYTCVLISVYV